MPLKNPDIIAISMGCPVGVGPEIIVKMLDRKGALLTEYSPLIVGVPEVFRKTVKELGLNVEIREWFPGDVLQKGVINICCPPELREKKLLDISSLAWGSPTPETGLMMGACISYCVYLIQENIVSAMVTCPITKAALQQAGYEYPGHTEMLADLCKTSKFAMMMAGDTLRVTLVTIHESLRRVPEILSREKIVSLIEMTACSLKGDFNIKNPKIAVAGLNPHAGEGGIFGGEEQSVILPAIDQAKKSGWQVYGPFPPDTVFHKAARGEFDVVVCMYHDQGLIPFKLLHFEDGVNVTIGLPIVRTSVDHGTAYDIAGKGVASPSSLEAAYYMAADIAAHRKNGLSGK